MARKKAKKQEVSPRIVIDYGEGMTDITVTITGAEKINAKILQRTIRQITRQRKIELKKIIYATKLSPENFKEKFEEKADGNRRVSEKDGRDFGKATGDDLSVEQLAEEAGRQL